jgi:hypothetical protein
MKMFFRLLPFVIAFGVVLFALYRIAFTSFFQDVSLGDPVAWGFIGLFGLILLLVGVAGVKGALDERRQRRERRQRQERHAEAAGAASPAAESGPAAGEGAIQIGKTPKGGHRVCPNCGRRVGVYAVRCRDCKADLRNG